MKIACKVEGFKWDKCPDIEFNINEAYEVSDEIAKELLEFPFFYSLEKNHETLVKLLGGNSIKIEKKVI